ncbi:hypothetical protein ACIGXM_01645 [Kitasatospora sp. NPDC052896]|uniref:hypothetical protein n=1 Tax=Kitasatospora sp. NPDC052896 TaxID=3364061 RepID=UPI0037C5F09A
MRKTPRPRKTLHTLGATALAAVTSLGAAAPAHAGPVLGHRPWACEVPYSGELECGPPLVVPPGAHLWVGEETDGPTVFTVYTGGDDRRTRVGWGEMWGPGAARLYDNNGSEPVLVHVTEHADAPGERCGTRFGRGSYEVRR